MVVRCTPACVCVHASLYRLHCAAPLRAGKEVEETLRVVDAQTKEAAAKKEVVVGEEAIASEKAAVAKAIKASAAICLLLRAAHLALLFIVLQLPCCLLHLQMCLCLCYTIMSCCCLTCMLSSRNTPGCHPTQHPGPACCSDAAGTASCRMSARVSWPLPSPSLSLPWLRSTR